MIWFGFARRVALLEITKAHAAESRKNYFAATAFFIAENCVFTYEKSPRNFFQTFCGNVKNERRNHRVNAMLRLVRGRPRAELPPHYRRRIDAKVPRCRRERAAMSDKFCKSFHFGIDFAANFANVNTMFKEVHVIDIWALRSDEFDGAGIYRFRNTKTNRVYIGSSVNIRARYSHHFSAKTKTEISKLLHESPGEFVFCVLEKCDASKLRHRENFYLKEFKSYLPEFGYNTHRVSLRSTRSDCRIMKKLTKRQKDQKRFQKHLDRLFAIERSEKAERLAQLHAAALRVLIPCAPCHQ